MLGTQRQMFLQSLGIRKEVSNLPRTLTESAASCQDQSAESGPETTARYDNANISHIHTYINIAFGEFLSTKRKCFTQKIHLPIIDLGPNIPRNSKM